MNPPDQPQMRVTFYHRKPHAVGNYSIEAIFEDVRKRLSGAIQARVSEGSVFSKGLIPRLRLCLEAMFRQGDINHITGDINFVGITLRKSRTVQTIHDCVSVARSSGFKRELLRQFWVALPVRRCAVVTTVSEATRQQVLSLVPGCPPEKVVVVPNAIATRFQRSPKTFDAGRPRILQLGTADNKNVPRLIEALHGLSCQLDIIGRYVPEYEEMLRRLGIRYTYRWHLPEEEVLRAYQETDIVSLVSTHEGFGMPILEGQAVGRPVITSNILSMPEVAGDAACVVDPFDTAAIRAGLERIIHDAGYREVLIERGYHNVRRFDPDLIAGEYLRIYRSIWRR